MSTGADCGFIEKAPGEWHYEIQKYPYGCNEEYNRHGPFPSFEAADAHLSRNYANPGGHWTQRFEAKA